MRFDIRFPVLARAKPSTGKKGDKFFYGSHVHSAEVPEVSTSDTDMVLGPVALYSDAAGRKVFPHLRTFEGRVYRPIGNANGLFDTAFDTDRQGEFVLSSPLRGGMSRNPLAYPVSSRCAWFIEMHGMSTARNYKLWPESGFAGMEKVDRNERSLENSDLKEINGDDIAAFMRMYEAQAERLLMVDGMCWMETTMPCVEVTLFGPTGAGHPKRVVEVGIGFLPLSLDTARQTTRFPLGMLAEAEDYANELAARFGIPGRNIPDALERITLPADDLSPLAFDQDEEEIHALAAGIASNVVRRAEQHVFHKQHANAPPLFEGAALASFETVREDLLASNDIVGERRGLGERLPEIVELWSSPRVKKAWYYGLGGPAGFAAPFMIDRAMEKLDNAPISIALQRPSFG